MATRNRAVTSFNGQELGTRVTWRVTLRVIDSFCRDTPTITDERFDPEREALEILSAWEDARGREEAVADLVHPFQDGVFDDYWVVCYRWGLDTVVLAAKGGGEGEPRFTLPLKWIVPTSTFQQVLLPLAHINAFIWKASGDSGNWAARVAGLKDIAYRQINEPMRFSCTDDGSRCSFEVEYHANIRSGMLHMFLAGQRLPTYASFGGKIADIEFLASDVFDVDPDRFSELDPHQSPRQLLKTLMEHPDPEIRTGAKRIPPNGYERFQTYVYGWCEETVIAFAPNPFTPRSTPDVWVIRNDDFRLMLKCAIDLFGTHTNLFPPEVHDE